MIILLWTVEVILWAGVACGVALDVTSCRLSIRRHRLGHGASGVPAVALVLFALRVFVRPLDFYSRVHRPWWLLLSELVGAVLFHAACQFLVPRLAVSK
jgi:hypothetical protein